MTRILTRTSCFGFWFRFRMLVLLYLIPWFVCSWFYIESVFTIYYCLLHMDWVHDTLFSAHVFTCARHLTSFYMLIGLLSDNPWTCLSRSRSLNHDKSFRRDHSGTTVAWLMSCLIPDLFPLYQLLRFLFQLVSIYQFLYFVNLFVNHIFVPSGDVIFMQS